MCKLKTSGNNVSEIKYCPNLVSYEFYHVPVCLYSYWGFRSSGAEATGDRERDAHRKRAGGKTSGSIGTDVIKAAGGL